jgi:hypothetical protein
MQGWLKSGRHRKQEHSFSHAEEDLNKWHHICKIVYMLSFFAYAVVVRRDPVFPLNLVMKACGKDAIAVIERREVHGPSDFVVNKRPSSWRV